jgi:arsenate reductase (thioredoxin)
MMAEAKKLLFVCTGNSIRSQMAEGLMKTLGGDKWIVRSAGVLPCYVHPLAVRVMMEIDIDISDQKSKSIEKFVNEVFDVVITLCDHAAATCPTFPGQARRLHWPIDDPVGATGTIEERLVLFRKARDEIKARIEAFLKSESM